MKSHERLKAEGRIEAQITRVLQDEGLLDEKRWALDGAGHEYLIEVTATYMGNTAKNRLTEPAEDVVD